MPRDVKLLRAAIRVGADGNASLFARQLGVAQSTVWRWTQADTLPAPLVRLCEMIVFDPGAWRRVVDDD